MCGYLTAQRSLHAAVLAGAASWQSDHLGTVHSNLSPDPRCKLAASVERRAGTLHLSIISLAEGAQCLHRIPLPAGCHVPEYSRGSNSSGPSISWAPASTHCALLLECLGKGRTAILLVLRVSDGAMQLQPLERLTGHSRAEDVQLTFASVPSPGMGLPRLAAVTLLPTGPRCWPPQTVLRSVGVELLRLSCNDAVPGSVSWAPNGAALCVLLGGPPSKLSRSLLLCKVGDRLQTHRILVPDLPGSLRHLWGPCSQRVLLLGRTPRGIRVLSAAFISASGELLSQQQTSIPLQLSSVAWGSAGLVAVACHVSSRQGPASEYYSHTGSVFICCVSEPTPALQVLHVVPTAPCITELRFSSGLLLAWLEHGDMRGDFDIRLCMPTFWVQGRSSVMICIASSGETVQAEQLGSSQFTWLPDHWCTHDHGMHLVWGASSRLLTVCGQGLQELESEASTRVVAVQQLCFMA